MSLSFRREQSFMKTFLLAGLMVILGPGFSEVRNRSEQIAGRIPGTQVIEDTAHWHGPEGDLFGFCFPGIADHSQST